MELSTSNINAVADLKPGYTLGAADVALLQEMARRLLAVEGQQPVSLDEAIAKFKEYNIGFPVERFKADYVIGWTLHHYATPQPAPVAQPVKGFQMVDFYTHYQNWLQAGAKTKEFSRSVGLCANLHDWCVDRDIDPAAPLNELHDDFRRYGLHGTLPFNTDPENYELEQRYSQCHKNPARVLWVNFMLTAKPAPVAQPVQVPDGLLSAMEEVLRISDRDHEAWQGAREGIAACRTAPQEPTK